MTSSPFENSDIPFDPGSMPSSSLATTKAVWYRRPWFLATAVIFLVVVVSVITDLPHPITRAEDTSEQNGVIKLINGDSAPCVYALKESYSFYRDGISHTLSASNLKTVKNYLLQDQTVCSFASGPISDMTNNIQVSDTAAGKRVDAALASVVKWLTYDGVRTVLNIRDSFATGSFHANSALLAQSENLLEKDRAAVMADIADASSILHTQLKPITLPQLPRLPGT